MLTQQRLGRIGSATIVAVVAGIVLQAICSNMARALGVWLIYAVVCAALLNTKTGEKPIHLTWMAALPAVTPLLVLAYPALFLDRGVCFSGVALDSRATQFVVEFVLFFVAGSWAAVTLFAFARNRLLLWFKKSLPNTLETITKLDAVVQAAVVLVGSIGLLYLAIVG